MNIVQITADSLTLSSGLSQDSFAKTHLIDLLAKKSLLVHLENGSFSSEEYSFTGTKANESGITLFEGKTTGGKTLSDLLALPAHERTEEDLFALASFSRAVDFLLRQEEIIEPVGAGGIVVHTDKNARTADILFLNAEVFEVCAQNHKENYADLQGKYLYKGLDSRSGLIFTRTIAAYRALTNHFPFENGDTSRRQEDIFDSNFIPLELWDSSIEKHFAESIHAALRLTQKQEILAGKRTISDAKSEQRRKHLLEQAQEFDSRVFEKEIARISHRKTDEDSEESALLAERRAEFLKKTARVLAVKRCIRRNKNRLLAAATAVFVISWFVSGVLRSNAQLVTTLGLTSTETTAVMYTMIHQADIPNLQEILKSKETKDLLVKMSGLYVSARQRLETSPENGTLSPEKWFFYKKESKSWMFGITQLLIDGKPFQTENTYALKKEKPAALLQENEKTLKKGDEVTHSAQYYFVRQQESVFIIEKMRDTVTLRWNGKEWHVVKVEGSAKTERIKAKDFIDEYYTLIEEEKESESQEKSQSSVRNAIKKLSSKYSWLPTEEDLRTAAIFLRDEYGSREAEKFLQ